MLRQALAILVLVLPLTLAAVAADPVEVTTLSLNPAPEECATESGSTSNATATGYESHEWSSRHCTSEATLAGIALGDEDDRLATIDLIFDGEFSSLEDVHETSSTSEPHATRSQDDSSSSRSTILVAISSPAGTQRIPLVTCETKADGSENSSQGPGEQYRSDSTGGSSCWVEIAPAGVPVATAKQQCTSTRHQERESGQGQYEQHAQGIDECLVSAQLTTPAGGFDRNVHATRCVTAYDSIGQARRSSTTCDVSPTVDGLPVVVRSRQSEESNPPTGSTSDETHVIVGDGDVGNICTTHEEATAPPLPASRSSRECHVMVLTPAGGLASEYFGCRAERFPDGHRESLCRFGARVPVGDGIFAGVETSKFTEANGATTSESTLVIEGNGLNIREPLPIPIDFENLL